MNWKKERERIFTKINRGRMAMRGRQEQKKGKKAILISYSDLGFQTID